MANRVLFISGRCPHSKKVLMGINEYPFLKQLFQIVNVDTQPFPNYIKTVPAILIKNQVVTGDKVFEYFGRLVESKIEQEQREKTETLTEKDQGQCTIGEDGLLDGYCGLGIGLDYSMISEKDDDCSKSIYKIETAVSFLEGEDDSTSLQQQIKSMEDSDNNLSGKRQQFDNDLERMQKERGEINQGGGMMGRPPQNQNQQMGFR